MENAETTRIADQYKKLFRLPTLKTALFFSFVFSIVISLPFYFVLSDFLQRLTLTTYFFSLIIIIALIDLYFIKSSPIASFRRFLFAEQFGLFPLIIYSFCSLPFLAFNIFPKPYLYTFLLLAASYTISTRFFWLYALFYRKLHYAIIMSLLLPITIYCPVLLFKLAESSKIILSYVAGLALLFCTALYMIYVDKVGIVLFKIPSFKALTAYMYSWVSSEPSMLEEILEEHSILAETKTYRINLSEKSGKLTLIFPEIHPGPFAPIGSYNLPADIINSFKKNHIDSIVFHTPSSHAVNLPSKHEVQNYLTSLNEARGVQITAGDKCSKPLRLTRNKVTVTGLSIGEVVIIFLSLAPHGGEDIPIGISEYVKQLIDGQIIKNILLVDAHNALGPELTDADLEDLRKCITDFIQALKAEPRYPIYFSFASISDPNFREIGPGGISSVLLRINEVTYALYSIDSNNAISSLKDSLASELDAVGFSLIEICTTDSHFSSGKMETGKGYYALGELSPITDITRVLVNLAKALESHLHKGSVSVECYIARVKTIGQLQIDLFSKFTQRVLTRARKGAVILVSTALLILVIYAIILL